MSRDYEYNQYDRMTPKGVADALGDLCNWGGAGEEIEFAENVMRQHRTLQQGIMRLFITVCGHWAKDYEKGPGWYDLRNEDTIKAAVKIVEATKDCYFPYI